MEGKFRAEVIRWDKSLYTIFMKVGEGSIETKGFDYAWKAKSAFKNLCNQLGIERDKYYFFSKVIEGKNENRSN